MIQSKVQNDPKEINRGMIKQKQAKRCDLSHVRSCVQHNVNRNEGMEFTEHVPTGNEIALQKKDGAPKVAKLPQFLMDLMPSWSSALFYVH